MIILYYSICIGVNCYEQQKGYKIVVQHKDRLIRSNFNILKIFFESHGVEVEYVEETLPKTYEAELIEDTSVSNLMKYRY